MMRAAAVLAGLTILAGTASASEQSEALSARALVELKRGADSAAMELFDQAVAADPSDALAVYHRGVAHSKLGQRDQAVADFRTALAIRPDLDEAALELGIALVESDRAAEAQPWLEQARRRDDLAGQAEFFLAIAALRAGHYEEARAGFERARAADPSLSTSTTYYLGVIDYRTANQATARDHFAAVVEQSPDSALGREAAAFLEVMDSGRGRGTTLYVGSSLQYDSNVVLAPSGGTADPEISDEADGRATITAGGTYDLWRSDRTKASLAYDFYQDLHFDLTEFNVQSHRPSLLVAGDFGLLQGAFVGQYDFYLLDNANWLHSLTASPMLVWPQPDIGRLEAYIRFQWREYTQSRFDILSGYNTVGGLRQVLGLGAPGRVLWASFEVDSQDSDAVDGELYEYLGFQGEAVMRWIFPWNLNGQLGYRYRYEDYNNASRAFLPVGSGRCDNEHRVGASLRKDLTKMVSLVAAWVGTWNESNKEDFEYDRNIVSLGVELGF